MRTDIHADYATYTLDNPSCEMEKYTSVGDVCSVLKDTTIHFVGDSFIEQMYATTLAYLKGGERDRMFVNGTSRGTMYTCRGERFLVSRCRKRLYLTDSEECGGTTTIKSHLRYNPGPRFKEFLENQVFGTPNTVMVIGMGLHQGLQMPLIQKEIIEPMLELKETSTWPRIVWFLPHAPGMLKTPTNIGQGRTKIIEFNGYFRHYLNEKGIDCVDPFNMTDGVVSYDGTHYGRAINSIKVQILINAIKRLKDSGWKTMI